MCSFNNNCVNDDAIGRKTCWKCKSRLYRENHPFKASYLELKCNARKRFIPFNLTLRGWECFCNRTGYLKLRGVTGKDMTVDRKNPLLGYTNKNIRMMTKIDNSIKKYKDAMVILSGGNKKLIYEKPIDSPF